MNKIVEIAMTKPVCDIGQFDCESKRALAKAVKSGTLIKTRAPFAGNFGSMKTYYATSHDDFDAYQAEQIAKFELFQIMDDHNRRERLRG